MRKSFAQGLREGNVDIRQEYRKLYSILHQEAFNHRTKSLYEVFGENFAHFYFRGTCLSIEEFDQKYGFNFEADPDDFDIDYNAKKYLIETRCSGALTKPYSAIAFETKAAASSPETV